MVFPLNFMSRILDLCISHVYKLPGILGFDSGESREHKQIVGSRNKQSWTYVRGCRHFLSLMKSPNEGLRYQL